MLYGNVLNGITEFAGRIKEPLSGIGIDTWGVDFVLMDRDGRMMSNPYSYRDPHGKRGMDLFTHIQQAGEIKGKMRSGVAKKLGLDILRKSFQIGSWFPQDETKWLAHYEKFLKVKGAYQRKKEERAK